MEIPMDPQDRQDRLEAVQSQILDSMEHAYHTQGLSIARPTCKCELCTDEYLYSVFLRQLKYLANGGSLCSIAQPVKFLFHVASMLEHFIEVVGEMNLQSPTGKTYGRGCPLSPNRLLAAPSYPQNEHPLWSSLCRWFLGRWSLGGLPYPW